MRKAQAARLPGTALNTPAEVLDDPHFVARGAFVDVDHPVAGRWKLPGTPFRPSVTPGQVRRPAPLLGEHTVPVLQEFIGLSDAEIADLRHKQVI
jgi:CoA:oxalate CoA-transferase